MDKIAGYFTGRPVKNHRPTLCDARRYEYRELEKATKAFTNLIRPGAHGDLGTVYKGTLQGGKVIAVQTLQTERRLHKQHESLVKAVSQLCHTNLLKFDGYCIDKHGSFLCYEYQRYQTLEECLLGTYKVLTWQQRRDILSGICEGLKYLEDFKSKVKMHIELKVDKIVLHEDEKTRNLIPKISYCVFWGQREDDAPTGYYYFMSKREEIFSSEIDINSFGILLLKIITGRSKSSSTENELVAEVKRHWNRNDCKALRDPILNSDCQAEIEYCIELALRCTSPYVALRPTVDHIASTLANLRHETRKNESVGAYESRTFKNVQYSFGRDDDSSDGLGLIKVDHVREYRYDELERATDHFSSDREIGRGAFGIVYKAVIGDKVLAVKKLQKDKFSEQFLNEVSILSTLRHRNLMKLEGYCFHSQGTMLCYEYLSDGTLQDRLEDNHHKLSWNQRYNIILGICRGLHYLHDECPDGVSIVHMDLKADNILIHIDVSGVLIPKIGDFGIAWPLDMNKQYAYTNNPLGNITVTPPEYQNGGKITTGVDIYSFGLIMLEMITGKPRTYSRKSSRYGRHIINQAKNQIKLQDPKLFIDESMGNDYLQQIHECIEIALDCVGSDEKTRPGIAEVSLRLAQIGQELVGRKLLRCTASRRTSIMDKQEPVMSELDKSSDISIPNSEVDVSDSISKVGSESSSGTMPAEKTDENFNDQQQEGSSIHGTDSMSYASENATPFDASQTPVPCNPSDLDFALDFEAIFEGPSAVELESTTATPAKPEMEIEKALKQLYETLCDLRPYEITEASVFIEEMVNKILSKRNPTADLLNVCLNELLEIISSDGDAIKTARERAAKKMQISEKISRCSKLKAIMQENAREAKMLAKQQAFLMNRREILCAELNKIDSQLKDIPASIAEKKKKGMEAQAEGKTLVEEIVREEAEIGDTSADDALLERVRKIRIGVCTQLEGIINKI